MTTMLEAVQRRRMTKTGRIQDSSLSTMVVLLMLLLVLLLGTVSNHQQQHSWPSMSTFTVVDAFSGIHQNRDHPIRQRVIKSSKSPFSKFSFSSSITFLEAKKVKRGGLADVAEAGGGAIASKSSRRRQQQQVGGTKKSTSPSPSSSSSNIAPGLADWVASKQSSTSSSVAAVDVVVENDDDVELATSTPTTKKNERRQKKNNKKKNGGRSAEENSAVVVQNQQINQLLEQLDDALQQNNNLADILSVVGKLLNVGTSTTTTTGLRPLLASKPGQSGGGGQGSRPQYNFRLAYVGSDDALCYIGTGLHKVPLARMQEVFLCCLGRNRIEILEVISITGPFPNVRNTLQGATKLIKGSNSGIAGGPSNVAEKLQIAVDSMTDGTGKELLAPGENSRIVDLDVYFSDERAIIAVVPPSPTDNEDADPLRDDGKNVLVFVREDDLDEKLDALRVS